MNLLCICMKFGVPFGIWGNTGFKSNVWSFCFYDICYLCLLPLQLIERMLGKCEASWGLVSSPAITMDNRQRLVSQLSNLGERWSCPSLLPVWTEFTGLYIVLSLYFKFCQRAPPIGRDVA